MAKRNSKLAYYLVGLIAISLVLLIIFKFTSESFAAKNTVSIYLSRSSITGPNNIRFISSSDKEVVGVPQTTADSIIITMPERYKLQNYLVYGYSMGAWKPGYADSGQAPTYVSFVTKAMIKGVLKDTIIRQDGGKNVSSVHLPLPTTLSTPSINITNLSQGNFPTLSTNGDPANNGANIRIDLIVM